MAVIACLYHGRIRRIKAHFSHVQFLAGKSHTCHAYVTKSKGDGIRQARTAIREGCTHLISIGGDGTLNEALNGLMDEGGDSLHKIYLGALPFGTGNDFLRTIGKFDGSSSLIRAIELGHTRKLDVGAANILHNGTHTERYFLNITDLGMGGVIAQRLDRYPRWLGKRFTYPLAILRTFLSFCHHPVVVSFNGGKHTEDIMSLAVANGKFFGAGLGIAPDADPQDGVLDLVTIGKISLWDYLRHLPELRKCQPIFHPEVRYQQVKEVEIQSAGPELPIDMDGEYVGMAPVRIRVIPSAIHWISSDINT